MFDVGCLNLAFRFKWQLQGQGQLQKVGGSRVCGEMWRDDLGGKEFCRKKTPNSTKPDQAFLAFPGR